MEPGECVSQHSVSDMVYARIDPSGQSNGGVTPNGSIYNIRASPQELTVDDNGHSGKELLRLSRILVCKNKCSVLGP